MSSFYFQQLDGGRKLYQCLDEALYPFAQYLTNSIKALKNKQIQLKFECAPEIQVELKPLYKVYQLSTHNELKVGKEKGWYALGHLKEVDNKESLVLKTQKKKVELNERDIQCIGAQYFVYLPEFDKRNLGKATWGFEDIESVAAAWLDVQNIKEIRQDGEDIPFELKEDTILTESIPHESRPLEIDGHLYTVEVIQPQIDLKEIPHLEIENYPRRLIATKERLPDNINAVEDKDYWQLETLGDFEHLSPSNMKGLKYQLNQNDVYKSGDIIKSSKGIECKIKIPDSGRGDHNYYWLQLIEPEATGGNEVFSAKSEIDYFFDDDVSVEVPGTKYVGRNDLKIVKTNNLTKKIVLRDFNVRPNRFVKPTKKILKLRVNTHQQQKQLDAIINLKKKPLRHLMPLMKLFLPVRNVDWETFIPFEMDEEDWMVLRDVDRPGNDEQRRFVEKAIGSPDFAVLEGPPGSGKTTAILELICQLAKDGKKILFCGSTHVAIDNVLERLEKNNLLEIVLPVRIGDKNRIQEDVRQFQIDNILENHQEISRDLLLDAANLVCGTTIGILQHPWFKETNSRIEPFQPYYDYLIIDECSKTTFQEFLVPASFAKKWILVGDVHQLSPFADREPIISNLTSLNHGKGTQQLNPDLQKACLIWQKLFPYENSYIVRVSKGTLDCLKEEYQHRKNNAKLKDKLVGFFDNNDNDIKKNPIKLAAHDLVFMEDHLYNQLMDRLPANFIILGDTDWAVSSHAYQLNTYENMSNTTTFGLRDRGRQMDKGLRIGIHLNDFFKEKTWADETAWRMVRMFELSQLKKENRTIQSYEGALKKLLPQSQDIDKAVALVKSIALPSILESIQKGMDSRGINKGAAIEATSLSEGMDTEAFATRHEKLSFQHRMHPDISAFPRSMFYDKAALKDNPKLEQKTRRWRYERYKRHSQWLHVSSEKVNKNRNIQETNKIITELKAFMEWAKNNPSEDSTGVWEVAVITFYRGQESLLREKLAILLGYEKNTQRNRFDKKKESHNIYIKLNTVDKFQGQEADLVFLSMVQNKRVGFMDSPNRLNVAITRAKFQLVIVGNKDFFAGKTKYHNSDELKKLAKAH